MTHLGLLVNVERATAVIAPAANGRINELDLNPGLLPLNPERPPAAAPAPAAPAPAAPAGLPAAATGLPAAPTGVPSTVPPTGTPVATLGADEPDERKPPPPLLKPAEAGHTTESMHTKSSNQARRCEGIVRANAMQSNANSLPARCVRDKKGSNNEEHN